MEKLTQSYHPAPQEYALPVTFNQGKPTLHPPVSSMPHGFSVKAGPGSQRNEADFGMRVIEGFFNSHSSPASRTLSPRPHGSFTNPNSRTYPSKPIRQEPEEESKENVERIGLPPSGNEPGAKEKEIVKLHLEGYTQRKIAEKAGLSQGKVGTVLRALGYNGPQYESLTDKQKEDIARLHSEGLSQRDMADRVGCSQGSVSNILCNLGYKALNRKPLTPEQKADIARLHSEGLSQRDIAARVGCSQSSVGKTLFKLLPSSARKE